jgi:hypothetical protein
LSLDAQIRSGNRNALGTSQEVQAALSDAFPGIRFVTEPYYRRQTLFEALRNLLPGGVGRAMSKPGERGFYGGYEGNGFSADFRFAAGDVYQVDIELFGDTVKAIESLAKLKELRGWIATYD